MSNTYPVQCSSTLNVTHAPKQNSVNNFDNDNIHLSSEHDVKNNCHKDNLSTQSTKINSDVKTFNHFLTPLSVTNQPPSLIDDIIISHASSPIPTTLLDYHTDSIRDSILKHTKLGNIKVSKALARSNDRKQIRSSLKMYDCSKYISWIDDGRRAVSLSRCHSRLCPICNRIKSRQYANFARRAIDQLPYDLIGEYPSLNQIPSHRRMIGVKLNLNSGEACTLDNIRTRIKAMHKVYGRLLRTKSLSDHLIGSIRSSEITQSPDYEHANPHIHALLLLTKDVNLTDLSKHIERYWKRAIKKEILRETKANINTASSFLSLEPLKEHTKDDVYSWVKYITKGSYDLERDDHRKSFTSTSDRFWVAIDKAIKGMRMISISGYLKDAFAIVKENHDKSLQTHSDFTHVWSDISQEYVQRDKYNPKLEPYTLSSSLSYAIDQSTNLNILFKSEHEKRQAEINLAKYDRVFSTLLSSSNYSLIEHIDDLIIYRHKDVRDHHSEPIEIERSSLVARRNQRLLDLDP